MDKCQCGSVLSRRAKKCRDCHMANVTKRWTCKCGNKMDKRSNKKSGLCRECFIKLSNINGEAKCITCGGVTSEPRAEQCKTCWNARPTIGHKISHRNSRLKRQYKINLDDYAKILEKQNNKCAICLTDQSELTNHLSVDHDRKCCVGKDSCGKCVRGLLCTTCNFALGHLKDNESLIQSALDYVRKHNMKIKEKI